MPAIARLLVTHGSLVAARVHRPEQPARYAQGLRWRPARQQCRGHPFSQRPMTLMAPDRRQREPDDLWARRLGPDDIPCVQPPAVRLAIADLMLPELDRQLTLAAQTDVLGT